MVNRGPATERLLTGAAERGFSQPHQSNAPEGFVPLVEPQMSHQEMCSFATPEAVILKITHARRLADQHRQASEYFPPDTDVITTTAVRDTKLQELTRQRELEIIQEFSPDYHIPADHSIYADDPPSERFQQLKKYISGTKWIADQIAANPATFDGRPPRLIPHIKGVTPEERRPCYTLAETLNAPCAMFYATQYFTGGNRKTQLRADLYTIDANAPDDLPLFLAGSASPEFLEDCPGRVIAAAGLNQWRSRLDISTAHPTEFETALKSADSEVRAALDLPTPATAQQTSPITAGSSQQSPQPSTDQ